MYKKIAKVFVIWVLSATSVHTAPIDEEKKQLIDELSILFKSDTNLQQFTDIITDELRITLEQKGIEIDTKFYEIVTKTTNDVASEIIFNNPLIRSQNYRFWDEHYETKEIEELRAFFTSNIGKKYINKMPEMAISSMSGIMSVQDEFTFTLQVKLLEKFQAAGYDTSRMFTDNFNQLPAPKPKPTGPSPEELTDLLLTICPKDKKEGKAIPVYRGPPKYPYVAQLHGVEGWVELNFTVTQGGYTKDIRVTNTSTGTIFDTAAIEAVGRYVYCEDSIDHNALIRIRFEMQQKR